jgi:hypothetical protein
MSEPSVPGRPAARWGWWLITALLGAGLVIDVIDGEPLKLATSALLFLGCLLSALVPPPRRGLVGGLIVACVGLAVLLVLYRIFGPGL